MEDMESHSCDADSEMLDDAAEQTCFAAVHSPVQVSATTDTEMSTELGHFAEPAGIPAIHDLRSRSSVLGLNLGDHTSVRTVSPGRDVSSLPTTIPRLEAGSKTNILAKIEGIFEAMVDVLLNERGQLNIAIMTRPSPRRQQLDLRETTRSHGESVQQLYFPGKTEKEAWRFGESDGSQYIVASLLNLHSCRDSYLGADARSFKQRRCLIETVVSGKLWFDRSWLTKEMA